MYNYKDEVGFIDTAFNSWEECEKYLSSKGFIDLCIATHGKQIPFIFEVVVKGEKLWTQVEPTKQGIPMDWNFYSGIDPITPADISAEQNIEKRHLLMLEYGVANYLGDVKVINTDKYGTLIDTVLENTPQRFCMVVNGTPEPPESAAYLRERGMLTESGHKIYYIPVPNTIQTCKQGIAWTWDIPEEYLPDTGWCYET